MVYLYSRIHFSHKREWSSDTGFMGIPWKYYAKWKKPDKKGHILYDSILYEMPRIGKSIETESRLVVSRGWG